MLNDISFDWTAPTATRKESTWSDKFEQLKLYKSKHGDYNVSYTYDKKLANWVQRQRSQYKHSKLSDDHIEMLNDIKFNWMVPIQQKDITWYDKFEELRHYKSKHGDYNVPSRYKENQLGSWVHRQRYHYKLSKLSEERINMLNDIGFNWTAPTKERKTKSKRKSEPKKLKFSDHNWNDQFEELELAVGNGCDTAQGDSEINHMHKQIAIETNWNDSRIEAATEEKMETPSTSRSLQDRIQVLCRLSVMFQKEKAVIYANMKKRKLDDRTSLK